MPWIFAINKTEKLAESECWAHYFLPETNQARKEWCHSTSPKPNKFCLYICIYRKTDAGTVLGSMRQSPEVPQSPVPHTVTSLIIT